MGGRSKKDEEAKTHQAGPLYPPGEAASKSASVSTSIQRVGIGVSFALAKGNFEIFG